MRANDGMNALIGRVVSRCFRSPDQSELVFETDAGPLQFFVDGDCCSQSWFESVEDLPAIAGRPIVEAIDRVEGQIATGPTSTAHYEEVMSYYGYYLRVADGARASVEFRNSSNGYYGGSCSRRPNVSADYASWEEIR